MRAGGFQDYRTSDLATDKVAKLEGKGSLMSEFAPPLLKSSATDVAVDQKLRIDDGKQCHQMGLDSIILFTLCGHRLARSYLPLLWFAPPFLGVRVHSLPILHF